MKQKLAIIAAWIHQPKLIIMDEPFVGLDPKAAHLLKGMMRAVCDGGGAIFYSVVARDTLDTEYAAHRQRFLAEQGYAYRIVDADDLDQLN